MKVILQFVCVGLGFVGLLASAGARAEALNESTELLVRYREPQNTEVQAAKTALFTGAQQALGVGLVNSEQGLVKLVFDNAELAREARERLLQSDEVESVSENNTYLPALYLHAIEESSLELSPSAPLPYPAFPFPWGGVNPPARVAAAPEFQTPPVYKSGPDPLTSGDWANRNINMPALSSLVRSKFSPVISAVIDTGVHYNHEDLSGAMWQKPGNPKEVGYDFAHNVPRPFDVRHFDLEGCMKDAGCSKGVGSGQFLTNPGHGTHVAGRVGAILNNSLGLYGAGAPAKTSLMALKFFYDAGEAKAGQGDDAAAIRSIDYAIKNGAKVINASWGGRMSPARAEQSELKKALIRAQQAGVLVVIAAGNDGINNDTDAQPGFPAAYTLDNTIVVAATDPKDAIAGFSNYGVKTVHIGAPGVRVLSTTADGAYNDLVARFKDKQGVERAMAWDGTSMAAPIVAGAAALLWSKYPKESYRQIKARILGTARKVPGLAGKVATGGVLDVSAALSARSPAL
ncbi:MAG: S8 family serine peptidase [Oligoflexia bacterium]|nr:S8 family serine peptidase [Oligoflexia bacterium]